MVNIDIKLFHVFLVIGLIEMTACQEDCFSELMSRIKEHIRKLVCNLVEFNSFFFSSSERVLETF